MKNIPTSPPAPHLEELYSVRGFRYYPAITGTYEDAVRVYESSAASGPHVWIAVEIFGSDERLAAHLSVEQAVKFAAQILNCVEGHYQLQETEENSTW